mmetsp:Transcript_23252/g.48307  ORF Transcript_23252/g.48307 Transcript_23252/m.48307 type:complete len:272 (+) Transcript_23252:836-1651(+)
MAPLRPSTDTDPTSVFIAPTLPFDANKDIPTSPPHLEAALSPSVIEQRRSSSPTLSSPSSISPSEPTTTEVSEGTTISATVEASIPFIPTASSCLSAHIALAAPFSPTFPNPPKTLFLIPALEMAAEATFPLALKAAENISQAVVWHLASPCLSISPTALRQSSLWSRVLVQTSGYEFKSSPIMGEVGSRRVAFTAFTKRSYFPITSANPTPPCLMHFANPTRSMFFTAPLLFSGTNSFSSSSSREERRSQHIVETTITLSLEAPSESRSL